MIDQHRRVVTDKIAKKYVELTSTLHELQYHEKCDQIDKIKAKLEELKRK